MYYALFLDNHFKKNKCLLLKYYARSVNIFATLFWIIKETALKMQKNEYYFSKKTKKWVQI
jgi:hypothetical protein